MRPTRRLSWFSAGIALLVVSAGASPAGAAREERGNLTRESATMRGCVDNHNIRMVSFEHADSFLPEGFKSADAEVILFNWVPGWHPGLAPQGRSIAVMPALACEWSDWQRGPIDINWIVIPVERPSVPEVDLDPSYIDLYLVTYLTSGDRTRRHFRRFGYPALEAVTQSDFTVGPIANPPLSPVGSGTTVDQEGTLVDFEVAAAAPVRSAFHVRVWFQTGRGLGLFTWDRSASAVLVGTLPRCYLRPGSTHANVYGTTDCSATGPGGEDGVGATFSELTDFEGDFQFLYGRHAERGS